MRLILFILFLSIPVLFVYVDKVDHKTKVTIATGSKSGGYYVYAKIYKELLKKEGVDLEIVTTDGSIDAQKRLISGKVDFAFVQGGTEMLGKDILALANVAYEPIWVFTHDKSISSLSDLIGLKIAVGMESSGIYPVAKKLLNANAIDMNNSYILHMSHEEAKFELQSHDIDAMFYIASANSKLVQEIMNNPDIHLLNFKNASTYQQYFLQQQQNFHILKLYIGALDLAQTIPPTAHSLLAKKTILTTINASDKLTRLMMQIAEKVHYKATMFNKENYFPNTKMLNFKQHKASIKYFENKQHFYEGFFDYWTAQSLNKLHKFGLLVLLPLLTLFAFFVEVIVPSINWYTRRKVIKWYDKVNELDTGIEKLSLKEAKIKLARLNQMMDAVRDQDDIPATHMEEFYTLQTQITNITNAVQKRIDLLTLEV
jgi:TRAP transporter TAXI family solute receptor